MINPNRKPPTQEELEKLWELCVDFIDTREYGSDESAFQSDSCHLDGPEFICDMGNAIGWWTPPDEDDDV